MPYQHAWVVGKRDGALQRLIGLYKFERAKSAYKDLGDLMIASLPQLPSETIIVPVPTTPQRIRERGYDHMRLISKYISMNLGLQCQNLIIRASNTKQRQATASQRKVQARRAFKVEGKLDKNTPYLVIDDVVTTGSTIKYASQALRDAGAKQIWVAVVARQTKSSN